MATLLIGDLYEQMLAAADAAGASRINARASFVRENLVAGTCPQSAVRPGCRVANLRCSPPPCVELWTLADDEIASDWEVAP